MANRKTNVRNRQLLRSRITQQTFLSLFKINPGSGRVDGSPDCSEKHKSSSSTAITTSRQNTILDLPATADDSHFNSLYTHPLCSYLAQATFQALYPPANPRAHILRMRRGANTYAPFVSSQRVQHVRKNRFRILAYNVSTSYFLTRVFFFLKTL